MMDDDDDGADSVAFVHGETDDGHIVIMLLGGEPEGGFSIESAQRLHDQLGEAIFDATAASLGAATGSDGTEH
jgi:hypothetical protein